MPDERTNNGRRQTDALFPRGVKIAGSIGTFALIAVTIAFKLYAQSQDFPRVKDDVDSLKVVMRAVPQLAEQVNRIDARVAELYCAQIPVEKRAGCR